jgi:hypothetical protein
MKTYCKTVDITDPDTITPWVALCLKGKMNRKGFIKLSERYDGAHGIAVEIAERIKRRDLALRPIQYFDRMDRSCGKIRRLGIESPIQQCMDYIAVHALMPLLLAKVGPHQYASIPDRGQTGGKRTLEKWVRTDHHGTKYYVKMDVRHCFESIKPTLTARLLTRDIGKNKTLLWFVLQLVNTYEDGLSIGSYLSQWLCNYVISYAYHYASEKLFKERRGKQQRLFSRIAIYMDDIILFGADRRNLKLAAQGLKEYLLSELGLEVKPNYHIKLTDKEPPDMMGFVIRRGCTTIRAKVFIRARRTLIRAWRNRMAGKRMLVRTAQRIISYRGFFMHTDSHGVAVKLHLAEICREAKKIISRNAKKGLVTQ